MLYTIFTVNATTNCVCETKRYGKRDFAKAEGRKKEVARVAERGGGRVKKF